MEKMWVEVRPAGYLKKFGTYKFHVSSTAEAIKFMLFQVPGFKEAFEASKRKGLGFQLIVNGRSVADLRELHMGKPAVLQIVPRQLGRKSSGMAMIFIAVAIAAAAFTGGASLGLMGGAGFGAGGWLAAGSVSLSIATSMAISLALGGITQLLTPQPEGLSSSTDADNKASYAFGGPVNTTAQGNPIPAFYGEREVGGAVISANILAEDQQ